jgi:pyruvate dehydrogenase E2 component (dihydrolipoamide acetyltransferase)
MADIVAITMPKFGLAMTEGAVAAWHKAEGDMVALGEELADIETSKITSAYESPAQGVLRRHVVKEGETVPVGALIGVLAENEVADASIDAFVAEAQARLAAEAATADAAGEVPAPRRIETPAGPIQYLEAGPGDADAVVFIHGFGGDLNSWLFSQPDLAERFRTIALDLPGHGGSTKSVGSGDIKTLTAAVSALLDALDVQAAHLVGHSMGGAIALELAELAPGRVRSLTLISPAGLGGEVNMAYVDGLIEARRPKQLSQTLELLFADPGLVNREMTENLLRFKRLDGVDGALRAIAGANFPDGRQAASYREALARFAGPAVVVWGRQDRILPASHSESLPARVEVSILDDAGHMAHMEKAAEVNRLIASVIAAAPVPS